MEYLRARIAELQQRVETQDAEIAALQDGTLATAEATIASQEHEIEQLIEECFALRHACRRVLDLRHDGECRAAYQRDAPCACWHAKAVALITPVLLLGNWRERHGT